MTGVSRRTMLVVLAQAAVWIIWGSTYLGLRFGLEGFPPFLLNGIRFVLAGGGMYLFLRLRGRPAPSRVQWWNMARVGALLLVGGVGLVTVAEDLGVGSGVAATAVAAMPLWVALISGLYGSWPVRLEWIGLLVGFAGVITLAQEGDFQATPLGMVLVLIAPIFWSFGSMWGRRLDMPGPFMATAGQLFVGGVVMLVLGPVRGERITEAPNLTSVLALAYLAVLGSVVAYSAYIYLLREVRPAMATSYAYVNPVVAVVLGVTLGSEVVTGPIFVAMPLILAGVALVTLAQSRPERLASARRLALATIRRR